MPLFKLILLAVTIYIVAQLLYSGFFLLKSRDLVKKEYTGDFTLGRGDEFTMFAAGDSVGAGVGASSFETSVVGRVAVEIGKNRTVKVVNKSVSGYRMVDLLKVTPPTQKQD